MGDLQNLAQIVGILTEQMENDIKRERADFFNLVRK